MLRYQVTIPYSLFVVSGLLTIVYLLFQELSESKESDQIRSDQSLSHVRLFATPWIVARQASLSITNSRSSLRLTSIKSVMPSSHLILCRPLLLLPQSLPASESFPMSQLFAWGGQSTGVSALASFPPKKSQGFRMSQIKLFSETSNVIFSASDFASFMCKTL